MDDVRTEFVEREKDLMASVKLVQDATLSAKKDDRGARAMRAACYLLMYNLVEATARNVVQAVFDRLQEKRIPFDDVRTELKTLIWKHARDRNTEEFVGQLKEISVDIVSSAFDPNNLFSGNVDARTLREIATEVGYSNNIAVDRTGPGMTPEERLLRIKTRRNELAHGFESFAKMGQDVTSGDLDRDANTVIDYLRCVVDNVSEFLSKESYLAPPEPSE